MPLVYTGVRWDKIRTELVLAAHASNGAKTINGVIYPLLTNGQALAILQAWRKLLQIWKIKQGPFWPSLWYAALGYRKPGDRFQMTHAHMQDRAPDDVIAATWEYVTEAGLNLDQRGATPLLLTIDGSWLGYERAASEAWQQLKRDRKGKAIPLPPLPDKPPPLPVKPDDPGMPGTTPKLPNVRDWGLVVILLIAAFAISKKGK